MRNILLASTCLAAVVATPLHAETSITTATTAPVRTSTIKSGAADDIKISSAGSIKPTSGTAVTIDSNHKVVNEGTIQVTNASGATGIFANAGVTSGITNATTGKIIIDEVYNPTDIDNDGDLDGPFAIGNGRTGIATGGAFTGNIVNSGDITIRGNDSAGIRLGGPLTGNFTNDGTIAVIGDRALGVGLQDVTGNVRLAGKIAATGVDAVAARVGGNITGALVVQGELTATGYRYATAPADPSKLDADDLLIGGPALSIEGNVTGGVILAVPPKDTKPDDKDEDKDGIEDAKEGSAAVRSYGSAPAMRIGSASQSITIGAVAGTGTGLGLIIDGQILGSGVYAGKAGNGLQVGGMGNAVTIAGGIGIGGTGSVVALSKDSAATAIRIASGAATPELRNAGKIEATVADNVSTAIATAVLVETGSSLPFIRNSGTIAAKTTGANGTARGIVDLSGNVGLIENSGIISAVGATATSDRNIAIDLSANNAGATVKQIAVGAGVTAPSIVGDIRFGNGNDIFDVADGTVKGNSFFGAGDNRLALSGDAVYTGTARFGAGSDTLALAGTSVFSGTADFGGGTDTLTIGGTARFSAALANSQGLAVSISGGTFDVVGAGSIASLAVADKGALGVTLGGSTSSALTVAGNASFGAESKLILRLSSLENAEGNHVVLSAGTVTGANNLTASQTLLPFLYKGALTSTANTLVVNVAKKSVTELGLNRSEAGAFNAVLAAAAKDDDVEGVFLGIADGGQFRNQVQQMLPEHEGGVFETVTSGSRALSRYLQDPNAPYQDEGKWGYWVNQAVWGTSKSVGDTSSYDVSGWGISMGAEIKSDVGNFGGSIAFLSGKDSNGSNANEVSTSQFEGALHWRLRSDDGFMASARVGGAPIKMKGTRLFTAENGAEDIEETMKGKWDGTLWTASGSLAYDLRSKGNLSFRPMVAVDYFKLKEDGYQETGGGDALDLTVLDRSSDELAVSGTVAIGLDFGGRDTYDGWTRFELEAGRRQIVSGTLGATTASFKGGTPFTLTPEDRTSGWIGRLRGVAGNSAFQVGAEVSAEEQQSHVGWAFRASLRVGL